MLGCVCWACVAVFAALGAFAGVVLLLHRIGSGTLPCSRSEYGAAGAIPRQEMTEQFSFLAEGRVVMLLDLASSCAADS